MLEERTIKRSHQMDKIAIAQIAPVVLDREATIAKAVAAIEEAGTNGAKLIVFSETFIPCYPAWHWRLQPGGDWAANERLFAAMMDNAVDLTQDHLAPLQAAAKEHQVIVVCGINEKSAELSQSTLYNSLVMIDAAGQLVHHHRKLMPTNPERMIWGFGDGRGLKSVDSTVGRLGALVCWENYMPLARYALYAQGVEIYIAPTYDSGPDWIESMRHIAREGRCWVINCGCALRGRDFAIGDEALNRIYPEPDEWVNPGDSCVIAPGGEVIAGPFHEEEGLFYSDIESSQVARSRRALDVAGHYSRPDIFTLQVKQSHQTSLKLSE